MVWMGGGQLIHEPTTELVPAQAVDSSDQDANRQDRENLEE
jgi:hypothetical protein